MAAGYKARALHGDLSQPQRNRVIEGFKKREFAILVATDVAARGIDIPDVTHVINYGLCQDQESYVHRIGRTGRAGKSGIAITLLDRNYLHTFKSLTRKFQIFATELQSPTPEQIAAAKMQKIAKQLEAMTEKSIGEQHKEALNLLLNSFDQSQKNTLLAQLIYQRWLRTTDKVPQEPNQEYRGNRTRRRSHRNRRRR
jgi:ATP-dependent RNA helicase DeaD